MSEQIEAATKAVLMELYDDHLPADGGDPQHARMLEARAGRYATAAIEAYEATKPGPVGDERGALYLTDRTTQTKDARSRPMTTAHSEHDNRVHHLAAWFRKRGIDPSHITSNVNVEWSTERGGIVRWESTLVLSHEETEALVEAMGAGGV